MRSAIVNLGSARIELGFARTPPAHAIQQVRPTLKHHRARQGTHSIAKGLASHQHLAQQRLRAIAPLQDRMAEQRSQVEAEQQRRQVSRAVTTVMFAMIALRCAPMVMCVCALPSPPPRLGNRRAGCRTHAMMGEKALVRELLTRVGLDHRPRTPRHRQRLVTTAQEPSVDRPREGHGGVAAMPGAACPLDPTVIGLPKGHALVAGGRGSGLADAEDIAAVFAGN